MSVGHTWRMLCAWAGPLEATAANLAREVAAKQAEGRALQRRWAARQAELVGLAQARAPVCTRGVVCCVARGYEVPESLKVLGMLSCDMLTPSACTCLTPSRYSIGQQLRT